MLLTLYITLFAAALLIYISCVRGWVINWVGLFRALPGILADFFIQVWLSITWWKRDKWHPVNEDKKDEYDIYG